MSSTRISPPVRGRECLGPPRAEVDNLDPYSAPFASKSRVAQIGLLDRPSITAFRAHLDFRICFCNLSWSIWCAAAKLAGTSVLSSLRTILDASPYSFRHASTNTNSRSEDCLTTTGVGIGGAVQRAVRGGGPSTRRILKGDHGTQTIWTDVQWRGVCDVCQQATSQSEDRQRRSMRGWEIVDGWVKRSKGGGVQNVEGW